VIGALNQRAVIEARTLDPDGSGGFHESWAAIAAAWVRVSPSSGRDVFDGDQAESRTRLRVTLRRNEAVAAGQRVVIGSRILVIVAVLDEGAPAALMTLLCEDRP
jgi:SPP1 family predicted phage head-tail adaptor